MNRVGKVKFTIIFLVIATVVYILSHFFDFDIFEMSHAFLESYEEYELDELVVFAFIFTVGIVLDTFINTMRIRHEKEIASAKLELFDNTMHQVHDIVNNFLNNMQYFTYEAKNSNALSKENLELIEEIIQDTSRKLRELE